MKTRILQPEVMDDPDLEAARHVRALRGLRRLHRISGSLQLLRRELARLISRQGRPLRVLDVATGGGDLPIALSRWAQRTGRPLRIDGCDISATALAHARRQAGEAGVSQVRFFPLDALSHSLPDDYDVILFSLFLHHLTDDQCVDLLQRAAEAAQHIIVCDLIRSRFNLLAVTLGAHLLTRSDVVHTDAPLSVRAAFTPAELRTLGERAGLVRMEVKSFFPARLMMTGGGR